MLDEMLPRAERGTASASASEQGAGGEAGGAYSAEAAASAAKAGSGGAAEEDTSPPQLVAASITLRQCLEWALEYNLRLSVERLTPDIRDAEVVEALSAFDALFTGGVAYDENEQPTASLLAGGATLDPSESVPLETETSAAQVGLEKRLLTGARSRLGVDWSHSDSNSMFATLNPSNEANLSVRLTQPLLRDFGVGVNTAAIRIARNNKSGSVYLFRKAVEEALGAVEEAYWSLYMSIEVLRLRQDQLQRAIDQLSRAKKFVEAGKAAPVEEISAKAEVARVESEIVIARNAIRRDEDRLKRLINRPDLPVGSPARLVPADGPGDSAVDIDVRQAIAEALAKRSELKAAELEQANADIRLKVARNQRLPRLDLTYEYIVHGLGRQFDDSFEGLSEFDHDGHRLSLQAQIPIGNRAAESRCQQSRLLRMQTGGNIADLRQQVVEQVEGTVRDLRSRRELIKARRQATELARALLKDEEARYEHEQSTRTDVLVAQTSLAERELEEIQAIIELNINLARFHRVKGTYLEHNNIEIEAVAGN